MWICGQLTLRYLTTSSTYPHNSIICPGRFLFLINFSFEERGLRSIIKLTFTKLRLTIYGVFDRTQEVKGRGCPALHLFCRAEKHDSVWSQSFFNPKHACPSRSGVIGGYQPACFIASSAVVTASQDGYCR